MMLSVSSRLREYDEAWFVDCEYQASKGSRQTPICVCAIDILSGRRIEVFCDSDELVPCPFRMDERVVFVGFAIAAEVQTFIELNWGIPMNLIDLYFETRNATNGLNVTGDALKINNLLDALRLFELAPMSDDEKEVERKYILRWGAHAPPGIMQAAHRRRILNYCWEDVNQTVELYKRIEVEAFVKFDFDQALHRGAFAEPQAWFQTNGIPIDVENYREIVAVANDLKNVLVEEAEATHQFDIYQFSTKKGVKTYREDKNAFDNFVATTSLADKWGITDSGTHFRSDKDTLKEFGQHDERVEALRQLKKSLNDLKNFNLHVGPDGRNRVFIAPFGTETSRNSPAASGNVLLKAKWLRSLVKPEPGMAVVQIDISSAEAALAAGMSNDPEMLRIYNSGVDQYAELALFSKALTKEQVDAYNTLEDKDLADPLVAKIRSQYKVGSLAIQYGVREATLARNLNVSELKATSIIAAHRRMFRTYWAWAESCRDRAYEDGYSESMFGWRRRVYSSSNPNSVLNFPLQCACAELLRLACVYMCRMGLGRFMCAPLHDAVYFTCPIEDVEDLAQIAHSCLAEAGSVLTEDRVNLRTDIKIIKYPDRYVDMKKGKKTWEFVMNYIHKRHEERVA